MEIDGRPATSGTIVIGAEQKSAINLPWGKFELVFKNLLETLFVERMDQNNEIFARFMNDKSFQKVVTGWLSSEAYRKLNTTAEAQNSLFFSFVNCSGVRVSFSRGQGELCHVTANGCGQGSRHCFVGEGTLGEPQKMRGTERVRAGACARARGMALLQQQGLRDWSS